MFVFKITDREANRVAAKYDATPKRVKALGLYLLQQVKTRFATRGMSGGVIWPQKRMVNWGYSDGRAILTGASGHLLDSFAGYGVGNTAVVGSICEYAHVHQLGTVGKGGTLPTIKPKRAKALFIPITDRAINSERITGPDAAYMRVKQGGTSKYSENPMRVGIKTIGYRRGKSMGMEIHLPLVKGRLKDGKLEKWDERIGHYVPGVPDFIWLSRVDIAPRPMLPNSPQEQAEQRRFIADTFRPSPAKN